MIINPVRKALLEQKVTLGTWLQAGNPAIAEIFANAGFDWLGTDFEHTDINMKDFTAIARAIYGRGIIPLARVSQNDTLEIRKALDNGARGVIVPLVNNAQEAKRAVEAAKFPPQGVRGFSFCRANNWGIDFDTYAQNANDDIAVVVMIESKEAAEAIDEILEVEGVDGVFIGPYDMSGSYGIAGQTSAPVIQAACKKVIEACKKHKKSAGIHVVKPTKANIAQAIEQGFTFIALGVDIVFLDEGCRNALQTAKQAMKA